MCWNLPWEQITHHLNRSHRCFRADLFPYSFFYCFLGEHCLTSRDTLFSQKLTSQQGQTGIPLFPLTRSQFFKTVFPVPPSIALIGRGGCGVVVHRWVSQTIPDRLVMSAMGAMCCHACLVFPRGFSKGKCWLASDGYDTQGQSSQNIPP